MKKLNFIFMIYAFLFIICAFFYGTLNFGYIVRNFENKYTNNKSLVYIDREKNINDSEKRLIVANLEARRSMKSFNSIQIFFYICASAFSLSLYKNKSKSKEISFIFLVAGLFILLLTFYFINISIYSYYIGSGDSIFNMLNRDRIMIY